ncbi:MAG: glycosyltransferase [Shimia sp.]
MRGDGRDGRDGGDGGDGVRDGADRDGTAPRRALRIAHVTSGHEAHDTRIAAKQCAGLAAAGHDVALVVRRPLEDRTPPPGMRLVTVPRPAGRADRFVRTARAAIAAARALDPDIYHLHDPELLPHGIALARRGAVVVYDVHENYRASLPNRTWLPGPLRDGAARAVAALEARMARHGWIAAATPEIAALFPPARTALVQNFPALAEFGTPPPYAGRPRRLVYVGAITEERGITDILAALPAGRARLPDVGFDLIGPAPEALLETMRAMEGWAATTWHGRRDRAEVVALLGRAQIGLVTLRDVPRYRTSQPTKLYEYMAAGIPFLASDFPEWRAQVGAEAGRYVRPGPDALAPALIALLETPEAARAAMGAAGRALVAERFSWEADLARLQALYDRAMAQAHGPGPDGPGPGGSGPGGSEPGGSGPG